MPTVVFDFDSTLVCCESLDEILGPRLSGRPDLVRDVVAVTREGMDGKIPFSESLRRRFAIAAPIRSEVVRFAESSVGRMTPGMDELVAELRMRGVDVSIVSGAMVEAMTPVAERLGVPPSRIHGLRVRWEEDGRFLGFRPDDPFVVGKAEGVADVAPSWARPRIGIGDGATDLALWRSGAVDHFVAFTQHARRAAVLVPGVREARDVGELRRILGELL